MKRRCKPWWFVKILQWNNCDANGFLRMGYSCRLLFWIKCSSKVKTNRCYMRWDIFHAVGWIAWDDILPQSRQIQVQMFLWKVIVSTVSNNISWCFDLVHFWSQANLQNLISIRSFHQYNGFSSSVTHSFSFGFLKNLTFDPSFLWFSLLGLSPVS